MTVNNKLAEAEYFFEQIKRYSPDIKLVKYYFSAFLYSTNSIFDFLLVEAAQKFKLGLSMDKKVYPSHFKTAAKGNEKAMKFYKFWEDWKNEFEKSSMGKVFTETRHLNAHKISQKPQYAAKIEIDKRLLGEKNVLVNVEVTTGGEMQYDHFLRTLETSKKEHLKIWNKKRDEKSKLNESNLNVSIWLEPPGLPRNNLIEVCQVVLTFMKRFVEFARKDYY